MKKEYIPFGKPNFTIAEIDAVSDVLRSGWISMGKETVSFEKEIQNYLGVPYVVAVSSCTAALFLSLKIKGIKEGDAVIVPSLTFCATANAAIEVGATPIFCDVDPISFNITPELIKAKITEKTKAIVLVHFGGLAIDVEELRREIPNHIHIIEDAAHAFGSKYPNNLYVGSSGNLVCFSFYANKNLSTGEGGAIALYDKAEYERLQSIRMHGIDKSAWNRFKDPKSLLYSSIKELGYKMNYTDIQAALGRVQLSRMDEFIITRSKIADIYYNELIHYPEIIVQKNVINNQHSKHLFCVCLPENIDRDELILKLRDLGVGASIHYYPLDKMPFYQKYVTEALPNTDKLCNTIMTLPISSSMSEEDAEYVIKNFIKLYEELV